jgi:multidrug efflux system membrane fusion protein
MKHEHPPHAPRPAIRSAIIAMATAILLSACSKPVERAEEIRPVRAMRLSADNADVVAEFSGEVRARVESRLGFRVGGKIVARKVDPGSIVKKGQLMMQLDPQDLRLAQAQASAGLKAAESNRDLAQAELKRYQDLREKNFVSQAVLDSKQTAYRSAQASYDQAVAAYRNQSNQAAYASLISDVDGVVTSVEAEVGQVVAAGSPVIRVAQTGDREIVIGIPEDKVEALRSITDIRVRTWAKPEDIIPGTLRELSPIADPATRTYTAKVSIPATSDHVKLGMTAYVTFASRAGEATIRVPVTALFQDKSNTAVWIVEGGIVKLVPVRVAGTSGNDILLASGVSTGQTVVTAGVNLLKPGQKVSILGDERAVKGGAGSNVSGSAQANEKAPTAATASSAAQSGEPAQSGSISSSPGEAK